MTPGHLPQPPRTGLEVWGGLEYSLNRVGDRRFDQLILSGHDRRLSDLDLMAGLGIRAVRYPVLWERTAPDGLESADWSWPDERLSRLRGLGIRPIVGLVHHGTGPLSTRLDDPSFAEGLAEFAAAVAERYPWVEDYTPVNEPLTTARFTGLYGLWHPHAQDGRTFARILLHQCKAVAMAMKAIRRVNPTARLIQTEDIGRTYSTPALEYHAKYENERRWLTFDLLAGRIRPGTWMHQYLTWCGIPEEELRWFEENACPPDILGIDHYVTSERYLDERLNLYPAMSYGGNGKDEYADVEAVRAFMGERPGIGGVAREAWERYRIPVAFTEVHLGCTREEQLRWLHEAWRAAGTLREEGVDVRAVTAWAMLGLYDWDCLLTECRGNYEPGVFDLRAPEPRPTALASMLRGLATEGEWRHPALSAPGWWRRPIRLLYGPEADSAKSAPDPLGDGPPVLITGADGVLGQAAVRLCRLRGLLTYATGHQELDIAEPEQVEVALDIIAPWAVVNAAGFNRVNAAERSALAAYRANSQGPAALAAACARRGISLLTFTSAQVFDGASGEPYVESDATGPLNVVGRSQAQGEERVRRAMAEALIVRTGPLFGPWDDRHPLGEGLLALSRGQPCFAASGVIVSPTYVPDLVNGALDLLIDGESGLWHLANQGALSWAETVRMAAEMAELDAGRVRARNRRSGAPVPEFTALASERGWPLPPLEDALARYVDARWNGFLAPEHTMSAEELNDAADMEDLGMPEGR